jgi:hypothetical protein
VRNTTATMVTESRDGTVRIGSLVPDAEAKRLALLKVLPRIKVNENGCWVWQGWCNPDWGYGHTSWRGRQWAVHRLIWTAMRGDIPAGKILCHRCDNPPCCNPEHLWLGTDQENHIDKTAKGRHHYDKATKTHCKWGHEFSPDNTRYTKVEGRPDLKRRACMECQRIRSRERFRQRTPEQQARINEMRNTRRARMRAERQQSTEAQA